MVNGFADSFSRIGVPDIGAPIVEDDKVSTVRAKDHIINEAFVEEWLANGFPGLHVPYNHTSIYVSHGDSSAVWTKAYPRDESMMTDRFVDCLTASRIPDMGRRILAGYKEPTVRAKGQDLVTNPKMKSFTDIFGSDRIPDTHYSIIVGD